MARRRGNRTAQTIAYVFSALVALSMILSLIGPLLLRTPTRPSPTRTPVPTPVQAPTQTPTAVPPTPTATPLALELPLLEKPSGSLVFAVCGDHRDSETLYRRLLDQVVQDGNAFLIHTGNLVSEASQEKYAAFGEWMADFALPFYPVPGSHDADVDGSLAHFVEFGGAPAPHYSFDTGTVHLAIVNGATGEVDESELAWLDRDLAMTDKPIKMVFIHYPPFDLDGTETTLRSGSAGFAALMRRHNVNYVFSGNAQAYSQQEREGTTYVIVGGPQTSAQASLDVSHYYVQVTVDDSQVDVRAVPVE